MRLLEMELFLPSAGDAELGETEQEGGLLSEPGVDPLQCGGWPRAKEVAAHMGGPLSPISAPPPARAQCVNTRICGTCFMTGITHNDFYTMW